MRVKGDAVAAVVVAVVINVALLLLLLRVEPIDIEAPVTPAFESVLRVVWVRRPAPAPPILTPPPRASITAGVKPRRRSSPTRPNTVTTAAPLVLADDTWAPLDISRHDALPADAQRFDFAPNPLGPSPRDLARRNILPTFEMRDTSVLGKLTGMGQASVCSELRQLARGSDGQLAARRVSREVVLRSMRERGCPL